MALARVGNVLSDEKKQQVVALGRLGWPLCRIEDATGVRRETATAYLKAAVVPVRPPRGWGRRPPAKPANGASTDSSAASNPANEVSTDLAWPPRSGGAPAAELGGSGVGAGADRRTAQYPDGEISR